MSEKTAENPTRCRNDGKHGGRRVRFTIAAVTLLALGAALGAGATAHASRMGWGDMGSGWRHVNSEEEARERALDAAAWMLGRIDASPEQQARINEIVGSLVNDLYPLRAENHERRRQLITELARPKIDPEALERLRADGVSMVDSASRTLVGAVVDASEVLTMDQREQLARMIASHRH
jgi:Spy/CpxP family protein refolding chaperone